jgi:hypothetical protein
VKPAPLGCQALAAASRLWGFRIHLAHSFASPVLWLAHRCRSLKWLRHAKHAPRSRQAAAIAASMAACVSGWMSRRCCRLICFFPRIVPPRGACSRSPLDVHQLRLTISTPAPSQARRAEPMDRTEIGGRRVCAWSPPCPPPGEHAPARTGDATGMFATVHCTALLGLLRAQGS